TDISTGEIMKIKETSRDLQSGLRIVWPQRQTFTVARKGHRSEHTFGVEVRRLGIRCCPDARAQPPNRVDVVIRHQAVGGARRRRLHRESIFVDLAAKSGSCLGAEISRSDPRLANRSSDVDVLDTA